ncbi:MAG TPA: peptidase MA family metallohydrolase [Polyangiaceae bacterium]
MARVVSALLLLLALLWQGGLARAADPQPGRDTENIRTGHTELSGPSAGVEPPPAPGSEVVPPSDAPRVERDRVKVPAVAPGFNTYDGGWIRFTYHPSTREQVEPLIAAADQAKADMEDWLGQPVLAKVRVDVARTPGEMETLAPEGAPYPRYASGVAYSSLGLVLLTIAPRYPNEDHDLLQIFRHELAHVALHDAVNDRPIPRWFNEGFAVLASGETSFDRMSALWTATIADRLLPLAELDKSFAQDESRVSVAYAQAADVVRFLVRREERHRFRALVRQLREGHGLDAAARQAYGVDLSSLEFEWREDVAKRYTFWPVLFSGTVVWVGVLGLFVLGWRKRRARAKVTLERWARDEAREDALKQAPENSRIHIVLARAPAVQATPLPEPRAPEIEVPRVQHEGQWHTLH